jgi:hypothetical protein
LVLLLVPTGLSRMVLCIRMMLDALISKTICVRKHIISITQLSWREVGFSNICSLLEHGSLCSQTSSPLVYWYPLIWLNSTKVFSWVGMSSCMTMKKICQWELKQST